MATMSFERIKERAKQAYVGLFGNWDHKVLADVNGMGAGVFAGTRRDARVR